MPFCCFSKYFYAYDCFDIAISKGNAEKTPISKIGAVFTVRKKSPLYEMESYESWFLQPKPVLCIFPLPWSMVCILFSAMACYGHFPFCFFYFFQRVWHPPHFSMLKLGNAILFLPLILPIFFYHKPYMISPNLPPFRFCLHAALFICILPTE